jgi:uncharacterized protein with FMN-binding domain
MKTKVKKLVGVSALGALSVVELLHLQQASATPVTFTGSTFANPRGGSVQVAITVDGASGVYKITSVATPLQPTGQNASYANYAIPTLTSEALAAQSASITAVTGASQISAAWINSLSSAIAAAAGSGQVVGKASVVVAPTPTVTATSTTGTPAPGSTSITGGGTVPVVVSTSTAIPTSVAVAPIYYPLNLPPYSGSTTSSNLSPYFTAVSTAISRIATAGSDGRSAAIAAAQSALSQLQAQANQSSGSTAGVTAYLANINTQMQFVMNQANQQMSEYYAKVVAAANQLYVNAQASAAAVKAIPAPNVTVTVTATPKATEPAIVVKPGSVIKKTFTCVKTIKGVTTKQTLKAFIVKCPLGFTLVKK